MTMPKASDVLTTDKYRRHELVLVAALVLAFVLNSWTTSLADYFSFRMGTGDFAIFEQSLYNTLHGRFMYNTFENGSHLQLHFSPIILLFVPIAAVWPSSLMLAWMSALGIGAAVWLLYLEGRRSGFSTAGVIVGTMLLAHGTMRFNAQVFHELALLPLPMVLLLRAYRGNCLRTFTGLCVAIGLLREGLFLLIAAWGVIAFFEGRKKSWVLWPLLIAALHLALSQIAHPPSLIEFYRGYGTSPIEMSERFRAAPLLPFHYMVQPIKLKYLFKIVLPFLIVLPFFRWWWLPALPSTLFILGSTHGRLANPKMHYSVEAVMWLAFSTFIWLSRAGSPGERIVRLVRVAVVAVAVLLSIGTAMNIVQIARDLRGPRYRDFLMITADIPAQATILAPRYLANHLARRPELYFWDGDVRIEAWIYARFAIREGAASPSLPPGWRLIHQVGSFRLFGKDPPG